MILLLRISILQLLRGDFFDSIDPKRTLSADSEEFSSGPRTCRLMCAKLVTLLVQDYA
jgi:hypothetical protein